MFNGGLISIASELQKALRYDENWINVYTDYIGNNVIKAPQIGGKLYHLVRLSMKTS